jgi:hypothetical protein
VLARLAMLRVAPLLPSPALRAAAIETQVGTGKQAHRSKRKATSTWRCLAMPVMHFYCGALMHLLSGVDTPEKLAEIHRVWRQRRARGGS